jgi:hypothetical protein
MEVAMKYQEVFSGAWKIVWKYKFLWIFGILSSCMRSGGGSSSGGSSGGGSSFLPHQGFLASPALDYPGQINHWLYYLNRSINNEPWIIMLLILALFFFISAMIVFSIFAGTLGRVGVARGAWLADEGKVKPHFSLVLKESWHYFWRVLGLMVLVFVAMLVIVSLIAFPIIFLGIISAGLLLLFLLPLLIPLGILALVLSIAVKILIEEAIVAIVGEDLSIFDAIGKAWQLLREYPLPQLVVGLVLTFGEMLVSIVIVLPFLIVFIPLLIALIFQTKVAFGIGASLSAFSFLIYLPLAIAASGILYAYIGSVWTLTFRRLAGVESPETA